MAKLYLLTAREREVIAAMNVGRYNNILVMCCHSEGIGVDPVALQHPLFADYLAALDPYDITRIVDIRKRTKTPKSQTYLLTQEEVGIVNAINATRENVLMIVCNTSAGPGIDPEAITKEEFTIYRDALGGNKPAKVVDVDESGF